jgi:hypothetical protein
MSRWTPCKRKAFIHKLKALGFKGPISGSRHQFIVYEQHRLTLPSNAECSVPQLKMMLSEVKIILKREISIDEWNAL